MTEDKHASDLELHGEMFFITPADEECFESYANALRAAHIAGRDDLVKNEYALAMASDIWEFDLRCEQLKLQELFDELLGPKVSARFRSQSWKKHGRLGYRVL